MEQLSYQARMARRGSHIGNEAATAIVRRHLDPSLTVTGMRKLYGGSINRVIEWFLEGPKVDPNGFAVDQPDVFPKSIVAKLNNSRSAKLFRREMASLKVYQENTALPVPTPIAYLEDEPEFDGSGLLMERIDGINLSEAKVTPKGVHAMQGDLAKHVVALHSHHRACYGSALDDDGPSRWLDSFGPVISEEFFRVRELLSSKVRWIIDDVIKNLEIWLPEQSTPTLVHGDLWSNNIMIDDGHPENPEIQAFIDVSASYCDPEYELAYLRMFNTADDSFFERYRQRHPLRPGFSKRCRVYWLNTMMMHVRVFGEKYVPGTEQLALDLQALDK
ncbi:MAG: fructosamine kinase family protein [Planctomycetota bacterium]